MTETIETLLEETIEIDAPPERVWDIVTDVPGMARRSPQVVLSKVKGGEVREGATFFNLNRDKLLLWPTRGKVVRFEPHTDFAFRIAENTTIWSFHLQPTPAGGTLVTQRREAPNGISDISLKLTKVAFGGQEKFGRTLRAGMRQTLERIKADAEGS